MSTSKVPYDPHALLRIADSIGTPTYVYSERILRTRCGELRKHLEGIPFRLLYAMKANSCPAVLQVMLSEDVGIDAVSPGECLLASRIGFPPEKILFSANNMTDSEMETAAAAGVTLNIGELSRLEKFGRFSRGGRVCIRVNPQVGAGHHEHVITAGERSKFGIPVGEIDAVKEIAARYDLRIIGLHQHIGSGIMSTDTLWKAMSVLLEAARSFPELEFINFGGGLGIPYRDNEPPLDLDHFGRSILEPLRAFAEDHPSGGLTYWFEPGRFLVAESGLLLVRVNTLKQNRSRVFAGADSGMGHLVRPAIYGAYHAIYNLSNPDGEPRVYDVTGNICESGDLFAREREIPEIREGDVLAILDAGAYGMAMASEYNLRPLPAEVLLTNDGEFVTARKRRSAEDLVNELLGME